MLQAYKINIAHKAAENLKELIQKTEGEIKSLEAQATDVQKNAGVYVPDEEDIIDKAVCNSLKDLGRPLDVGFVRISNGVYLCGNTRIRLNFVNSKLRATTDDMDIDFAEYIRKI